MAAGDQKDKVPSSALVQPRKADVAAIDASTPEAKKARDDFLKLPGEQQAKFVQLLKEGTRLLSLHRVQEAAEKLNEAEILYPEHPDILSAKGGVMVDMRDFDRASKYFSRGLALYPNQWEMAFNLAHSEFARKDYPKAEKHFKALAAREQGMDFTPRRLVDFGLILCVLRQGRLDEAKQLIDKFNCLDESPIHFYGMAAWHFQKGEHEKAQEWIKDAQTVFPAAVTQLYEDSLIELGWLFKL